MIAPLDLMKTSSRRNVNIPTENHLTESSTWEKMYSSGSPGCRSNYDISKATNPSMKEKNDKKNWAVVKFKFLASRQILSFLKKENHGLEALERSPLSLNRYIIINSYKAVKAPPVISVKHWRLASRF